MTISDGAGVNQPAPMQSDRPPCDSAGSGPKSASHRKPPVRKGTFIGVSAGSQPGKVMPKTRQDATAPRQSGKDIHNKFINRQVTRAAELGDMNMLFDVIDNHAADMNGINLATAFHRVAKLSTIAGAPSSKMQAVKSDARFAALLASVIGHISGHSLLSNGDAKAALRSRKVPGEMPVQCLSIVAWSCATLRIRNEALFAQIAAIVAPNLCELKSFELSNLLWAYAKLHLPAPQLFSGVADRLLQRSDGEYKVQCLSTLAWCFATMQWRNSTVFSSLAAELVLHADEAKPQEISTTLWAFAKNRHPNTSLFDVFGQAALRGSRISQFKLQELSNTAWAFATLGFQNVELFAQIEQAALSKSSRIESQSVANILWAFAKLQIPMKTQLFPTMLRTTVERQEQFKPQELSAVIWAASQIGPDRGSFFSSVAEVCFQRLSEFTPIAVANLVKTLASVQIDNPTLYVDLLAETQRRLPELQPQSLSGVVHGSAVAAVAPAFACQADAIRVQAFHVCEHIASRLTEFKHAELLQLSATVKQHRDALGQKVEALEWAINSSLVSSERQQYPLAKTSDEKDISTSRQSYCDSEDVAWPTHSNNAWSASSSQADDSVSESPTLRPSGEEEVCAASAPEPLLLAPALQTHEPARIPNAPPGESLASLIAATHQNKPCMPNPWNQGGARMQAFDDMPWKVPLPSYAVMAPPVFDHWTSYTAFDNPIMSEAMLAASLHAMFAAKVNETTVAAGMHGQQVFPAMVPAREAPPGLHFAAGKGRA